MGRMLPSWYLTDTPIALLPDILANLKMIHYSDVIIRAMASRLLTQPFVQAQINENILSTISLAFVRGIHRWPVNSPHKGPITRKMFPFSDVTIITHQEPVPYIGNLNQFITWHAGHLTPNVCWTTIFITFWVQCFAWIDGFIKSKNTCIYWSGLQSTQR